MEFNKCLCSTQRLMKYTEGSRNSFLFTLGNKCFRKGLEESEVKRLAAERLGDGGGMDTDTPIGNAYTYTDRTERAEEKKKIPLVEQVIDYLNKNYAFRRNTVLDRLEMCDLSQTEEKSFYAMRNKDFNSIFLNISRQGIAYPLNSLKSVIDSDYSPEFNPFTNYFEGNARWDRKTDTIRKLADTIQAEDQEFWKESFRRWFVGMLACALQDEQVNHLVIILYSEQGKGKSTWIRRLLPPQWREYYRNGMVNPDNKDHQLLLSTHLIINMEEFEGARIGDLAGLKRVITQESVTERKAYDMQAYNFIRHASFIASTNNRQCLQDIGGNRRFLPSSIITLDYRTPVNYEGIYAQAYALIKEGYRYWYEGEEINELNRHNELHRMKDPVEENLLVYFRKPQPQDYCIKWMPAAAILSKIAIYGKIQVNRQTIQTLVMSLEKYGFRTRRNEQGSTEYEVVDIQNDEVDKGFK